MWLHYTVETFKRHAGYEHDATQGRREQDGIGDAAVKFRRNIHVLQLIQRRCKPWK